MTKRMVAIAAIYLFVGLAWVVPGGSVSERTWRTERELKEQVSALWGANQTQVSPQVAFVWDEDVEEKKTVEDAATRELMGRTTARGRVMVTGAVARARYVGRVCVLSFRTHAAQIDWLEEDLSAALHDVMT